MKKIFSIIPIALIGSLFLTGCNILKKEDSSHLVVYSFSGSNEQIELNNGVMVFTPNQQILYGGEFSVLDKELKDITFYSADIYCYNDGIKEYLMSERVYIEGMTIEIDNNKSLGQMWGVTVKKELLPYIEKELYFKLETKNSHNEQNNYVLKLELTRITQ